MYRAEVERDNTKTDGPGTFTLWEMISEYSSMTYVPPPTAYRTMLGQWPCITGGEQLDDTEYGGLCPALLWTMSEPIAENFHPKRGTQFKADIRPLGGGKPSYYKRTLYGEDGYPFMIHVAGRSTGCIAIDAGVWDDFVEVINRVFGNFTFTIAVVDKSEND